MAKAKAQMSDYDREAVTRHAETQWSKDGIPIPVSHQDVRAAVDGLDAYYGSTEAERDAAIPEPARSQLTQQQKDQLAVWTMAGRYDVKHGEG